MQWTMGTTSLHQYICKMCMTACNVVVTRQMRKFGSHRSRLKFVFRRADEQIVHYNLLLCDINRRMFNIPLRHTHYTYFIQSQLMCIMNTLSIVTSISGYNYDPTNLVSYPTMLSQKLPLLSSISWLNETTQMNHYFPVYYYCQYDEISTLLKPSFHYLFVSPSVSVHESWEDGMG